MAEPFLGEIRMIGFNFAPRGWALCDGQILPISQNQSLYSLLGTTYGGDGRTVFNLPDLRGRAPAHFGDEIDQGESGGAERVVLTEAQLPSHDHLVRASAEIASTAEPADGLLAKRGLFDPSIYAASANRVDLHPDSVSFTGGNLGHENQQPYQALYFMIAIMGNFPSRN